MMECAGDRIPSNTDLGGLGVRIAFYLQSVINGRCLLELTKLEPLTLVFCGLQEFSSYSRRRTLSPRHGREHCFRFLS